jgi:IS5 family transposase
VIDETTRLLIGAAVREKRFAPRAMRVDSTVVEADVRWPSDAALAHDATRLLAREGARLRALVGEGAQRVRDRSRAASRRLRLIGRTVGRRVGRAGGAREQVLAWTAQSGELVRASTREARRLAGQARAKARGRGARRKLAAAARLDELADRRTVARRAAGRCAGARGAGGGGPPAAARRGPARAGPRDRAGGRHDLVVA